MGKGDVTRFGSTCGNYVDTITYRYAEIVVKGIDDLRARNSQMFTLIVTSGSVELNGPVHIGTDIEGITWMDESIVGHTGEHKKSHTFINLDRTAGTYTTIGTANLVPVILNVQG